MAKKSEVDFRIAVGTTDGPRSAVWRGYSTKDDVYISHGGLGGVQKFSFHKSLICRHAFTEQEGPAAGHSDRVMHKWRRESAQADNIAYALVARFPSDFLSTALASETKTVTWIPAAAPGNATVVEFIFSRQGEDAMFAMSQAARRTIINYTELPNGEALVVDWLHEKWNGEPFTMPRAFGRPDQHVVSKHDPTNTGRPVRVSMFLKPTPQQPVLIVDEFGAYPAPSDATFSEPMGMLSRDKVLKRGNAK